MEKYKLGEMETKLAELIWANAPFSTKELIKLCEEHFNWKRTTTYTMLSRLCQRDIFENKDGNIKILITKEEFNLSQGEIFINNTFDGSLPMFINMFSRNNRISMKEIDEIQKIIDDYRRDNND